MSENQPADVLSQLEDWQAERPDVRSFTVSALASRPWLHGCLVRPFDRIRVHLDEPNRGTVFAYSDEPPAGRAPYDFEAFTGADNRRGTLAETIAAALALWRHLELVRPQGVKP